MLAVDCVPVAPSDAFGLDVAGFDQLGEDALGRAFGDANALGHVAQPESPEPEEEPKRQRQPRPRPFPLPGSAMQGPDPAKS